MPIWSTCSCTFRNTVEHGLEHGPIPIEILDFGPIPRDLNILLLYKTGNWNTETRTPWNFHLLPPPARSRILWGGQGVGMSLFSGCSSVATLLYQLFCGNPAEPTLQKQSCSVTSSCSGNTLNLWVELSPHGALQAKLTLRKAMICSRTKASQLQTVANSLHPFPVVMVDPRLLGHPANSKVAPRSVQGRFWSFTRDSHLAFKNQPS